MYILSVTSQWLHLTISVVLSELFSVLILLFLWHFSPYFRITLTVGTVLHFKKLLISKANEQAEQPIYFWHCSFVTPTFPHSSLPYYNFICMMRARLSFRHTKSFLRLFVIRVGYITVSSVSPLQLFFWAHRQKLWLIVTAFITMRPTPSTLRNILNYLTSKQPVYVTGL